MIFDRLLDESDGSPRIMHQERWPAIANQSKESILQQIKRLDPDQLHDLHNLRLNLEPFVMRLMSQRPFLFDDLEELLAAMEIPDYDIYQLTNEIGTSIASGLLETGYQVFTPGRAALFKKILAVTDINYQNTSSAFTLAHTATSVGHLQGLEILIEAGANLDLLSVNGKSCRDIAIDIDKMAYEGYLQTFDAMVLANQLRNRGNSTKQRMSL